MTDHQDICELHISRHGLKVLFCALTEAMRVAPDQPHHEQYGQLAQELLAVIESPYRSKDEEDAAVPRLPLHLVRGDN